MIPDYENEDGPNDPADIIMEVEIKTTIMPVSVFEALWAGLGCLEEFYGTSEKIDDARTWLNFTMQGHAISDEAER